MVLEHEVDGGNLWQLQFLLMNFLEDGLGLGDAFLASLQVVEIGSMESIGSRIYKLHKGVLGKSGDNFVGILLGHMYVEELHFSRSEQRHGNVLL